MRAYRRTRMPGLIDPGVLGYTAPVGDVAYNTITSGGVPNSNTLTFSYTVGSGSYRLLLVGIGSNYSISSVAWGAVSLAQYNAQVGTISQSSFWYVINPTPGTATITITSSNGADYMEASAIDFYNVDQSTPFSDFGGQEAIDGTPEITLTGEVGDMAYTILKFWDNDGSAAAQAGSTVIWNNTSDGSWQTSGSTRAGATSMFMGWSVDPSFQSVVVGVTINKV